MVELLAAESVQVAFSTKLLMIMKIIFSGSVQMQAYVIEKRVFVTATRDFLEAHVAIWLALSIHKMAYFAAVMEGA